MGEATRHFSGVSTPPIQHHTNRRLAWVDISQTFFWHDNNQDVKPCFCSTWLVLMRVQRNVTEREER